MLRNLESLPGQMKQKSPERCMSILADSYQGQSIIVPDPNKYYVFVYKAKTPGVQYDQHPFVLVTGIYKWGFTGYNFHWESSRTYTWAEILTNLYEVTDENLNVVQELPIARLKTT